MAKLNMGATATQLPTFKQSNDAHDEDKIADQINTQAAANASATRLPHPQEQTPPAGKTARTKDFEVVDANALYAIYPQFFKLIPDLAKIRQAIKLGIATPGVVIHGSAESIEGEE